MKNSITKKSIWALVISVAFSFVLLQIPQSFAQETGSIEVQIKYTNGDRLDTWQTIVQVFQDDQDKPFVTVEKPELNPFVIDSLPLGHKYTVKVYVNSIFSGESFIDLKQNKETLDINIPLSGGMRFAVFYDDGQTPIENALVTVKSDDGEVWGKKLTDSQGLTTRFWLQSNNQVDDEDYYIAEVAVDEDLIHIHAPVTFFPAVQGDIKITTPWPKQIENLITISVYKDISQKVSPSDGDFVVQLYDNDKNKVAQSSVNVRGDAFFSNLQVGKYLIQVLKTSTSQESEVWSTQAEVISGKKNSFSVFKQGVFAQRTCNCVAFRLDDVQDWYLRPSQVALMDLFQQKKADLTIGVIGGFFGEDPHLIDYLKKRAKNQVPTLEIASHSWNNSPLTDYTKAEQRDLLLMTNEKLSDTLGVTPNVLITPQNLFDDNTVSLLPELGYTHYSAHTEQAHNPPYLVEDSEIFYFPANTQTATLHPTKWFWEPQPTSVTLDEIHGYLDEYGYAVVMMHPYEFAESELGVFTGEPDMKQIAEVGKIIDTLRDEGVKIVTISEIDKEVIEVIKPIVEEKPDEVQQEVESCDCVSFRFAPVQDYYLNDVQIEIIDIFTRKSLPITVGFVGNLFGDDAKLVDYVKGMIEKDETLIEVANGGWNYEDFAALSAEKQSSLVQQSNEKIADVLGVTPEVFIPPFENFNGDTILALKENQITHISSNIVNDPPPYKTSNSNFYHFPAVATISEYDAELGQIKPISFDEIFSEIQKNLDEHGFAVVIIQPSELSVIENGNYVNKVDEQKIHELNSLIDRIQAEKLKIVPVGEINLHTGGLLIPAWIKNNAGWWSDGLIGDDDFVLGIQFLINQKIMIVPPPSESSTGVADEIPSWIKNNAKWWSQGVITDDDFVSGIQWLITKGILKISYA